MKHLSDNINIIIILESCIDCLYTEFEIFVVVGTVIEFTKTWTYYVYSIRLCGLIYNFYLGCLSHCFGKEVHFPYYYQLKVEVQICHSHALDTEVASVPYYSCRGLGVLAPLLVYTDTSQLRRVREICYFFPHAILSVERSSVKI